MRISLLGLVMAGGLVLAQAAPADAQVSITFGQPGYGTGANGYSSNYGQGYSSNYGQGYGYSNAGSTYYNSGYQGYTTPSYGYGNSGYGYAAPYYGHTYVSPNYA